jgi:hypothetical protein
MEKGSAKTDVKPVRQPGEQLSGRGVLRPRARVLRVLGDELISSDAVAVVELIKNAYDADATRVFIRFLGPLEAGHGGVEIIDNGHGMSLDTIKRAWMEPATPFRKRRTRSEQRCRRVLGEKGIGRFASSRLADILEIVTRRTGMEREVRVLFDWRQFDNEERYLDEVEVIWEETEPTEICPGGTIEALWENDICPPQEEELLHGTVMRMRGLRSKWGENQFKVLRSALSRLVSPFWGRDAGSEEFQIRLEVPESFIKFSDVVEPPEIIKRPHYMIAGNVDRNGRCRLAIKLRGDGGEEQIEKQIEKQLTFPEGRKPQCGPFYIELRVWDRDVESLNKLASQYGSSVSSIREDLDNAAGISIYRDGFRVLPYGELYNDWLRLDLRSRLNPTLRLANNQVIGYVLISADSNPLLRDQSNREGLIEGAALDDLRELVQGVLNEIEVRRYSARPHTGKSKVQRDGLFSRLDLGDVQSLIEKRYPKDTELIEMLASKEKDLKHQVKEVQEILARYHRLATLGQLIDTVLHEGRTPVAKIGNEAQLGLRDIDRGGTEEKLFLSLFRQRFGMIKTQSGVLATVFRRIEPFGGRKRGKPVISRLEQVIADGFAVLNAKIKRSGVRVSLPETSTQVAVDPAEIQEVIVNLLQNSLYWLHHVPEERRKMVVMVSRKEADEVEILFSDSGPGVAPQFRERIFEPYFSTKPDGIGLGLTIAGEIVKEYYNGELELVDGGLLPGATFRIILRRRV